jgi:hypothetical protein
MDVIRQTVPKEKSRFQTNYQIFCKQNVCYFAMSISRMSISKMSKNENVDFSDTIFILLTSPVSTLSDARLGWVSR